MKLVIPREQWHRGTRGKDSYLVQPEDSSNPGMICFLGFVALAFGASKADLVGRSCPSETPLLAWPSLLAPALLDDGRYANSEITDRLLTLNDMSGLSDGTRERRLIDESAVAGIHVKFIGGAPCES